MLFNLYWASFMHTLTTHYAVIILIKICVFLPDLRAR